MKDVQPVVPDSLLMDDEVSAEDLDSAARSVIDSTYIVDIAQEEDTLDSDEGSEYMITKDREVRVLRFNRDSVSYKVEEVRYNTDQDNYMWYLRDVLVLPDIRLAQIQGQAEDEVAEKKERKGIRGFFHKLFKKKEKEVEAPVDSTEMEPPVERNEYDLDYVEEEKPVAEPEKKKGLKGLFQKKDKKEKEQGKVSSGTQSSPRQKKEKKPKKEKTEEALPQDDKPADDEVQGEEGF
jgi:hypothetical protein